MKPSGMSTHVSGLSWIIIPIFTILIKNFIWVNSLKLLSKYRYARLINKGINKNTIKINNKIFLCDKKIWYFNIKTKNRIAKTIGIEVGLEANNKNIIKKSFEYKILFLQIPFMTK